MNLTLSETEDKYRRIFTRLPYPIFVTDRKGFFIDVNIACIEFLGYHNREDVIGKNVIEFYVNPEHRDRIVAELKKKTDVRWFETFLKRRDGTVREVVLSIYTLRDKKGKIIGYEGILDDITDIRKMQREIENAAKEWRETFDSMIDGVMIVGEDKKIKRINKVFAELFNSNPKELIGKPCYSLIFGKDKPCTVCPQKRLLERGGSEIWDEHLYHLNKTFHISMSLIRREAKNAQFVYVFRDIEEFLDTKLKLKKSQFLLNQSFRGITLAMAKLVEQRDPYTSGHGERVSVISERIAKEMGLGEENVEGIRICGLLHDIGKISVPVEILNKSTKLTELEFKFIKLHPVTGYEILKNIRFPWPIAEVTLQHHERLNGSGYPHGLKGNEIIMEARILAVADVVEAISSHRPYRPALGTEVAMDEIKKGRGLLYDPDVVDRCLSLYQRDALGI